MKLALAVCVLAGCKSKSPPPEPTPVPPPITADAAKLPGTLYFLRNEKLVRLAGGATTTGFDDVGASIYPSGHALSDGRLVAIASKGDGSAGGEQLVLVGPGTKVTRFGPSATQVRSPALDRDGAWIIVEARFEPSPSLYRIDIATQKSTQITNSDKGDFQPAVLGDGVVFSSSRDGDSEIYRVDADGKQPVRLTAFHRDDWEPVGSPDGKLVAFVSDREGRARIFLMNADGTNLRRLTARDDDDVDEEQPTWSPDGAQLAYLASEGSASRLVLHDVKSAVDRVLSPPGVRDEYLAFSPDGTWIAVSRWPMSPDAKNLIQLHAIATEPGAAWLQITRGPDVHRMPRWVR